MFQPKSNQIEYSTEYDDSIGAYGSQVIRFEGCFEVRNVGPVPQGRLYIDALRNSKA